MFLVNLFRNAVGQVGIEGPANPKERLVRSSSERGPHVNYPEAEQWEMGAPLDGCCGSTLYLLLFAAGICEADREEVDGRGRGVGAGDRG